MSLWINEGKIEKQNKEEGIIVGELSIVILLFLSVLDIIEIVTLLKHNILLTLTFYLIRGRHLQKKILFFRLTTMHIQNTTTLFSMKKLLRMHL